MAGELPRIVRLANRGATPGRSMRAQQAIRQVVAHSQRGRRQKGGIRRGVSRANAEFGGGVADARVYARICATIARAPC